MGQTGLQVSEHRLSKCLQGSVCRSESLEAKGRGRRLRHGLRGASQTLGVAPCSHHGGSGQRSTYLCLLSPWHLFREMCKKRGMRGVVCSQIYCHGSDSLTTSHSPLRKTIGKIWFVWVLTDLPAQ